MPKVLIVDDSPIVTKLIESHLVRKGFEVSILNSPFGVSNKIREFKPHVVLMDLGLPGLSGEKLLTMFQETEKEPFKAILISSADESELKGMVRRGLASDYFIKGEPLDLLVDKVVRQIPFGER